MFFPCDVAKLLLKFLGASFTLGKMIHLYVLKMEVMLKTKAAVSRGLLTQEFWRPCSRYSLHKNIYIILFLGSSHYSSSLGHHLPAHIQNLAFGFILFFLGDIPFRGLCHSFPIWTQDSLGPQAIFLGLSAIILRSPFVSLCIVSSSIY